MVDQASLTSDDELASLPSETTTDSDLDLDSEYSDAEAEWRESIEQLELLLTMVLIPFVGKYLGRKCAYWGKSGRRQRRVRVADVISRLESFYGMEVSDRDGCWR